jgi:hypothetical protein
MLVFPIWGTRWCCSVGLVRLGCMKEKSWMCAGTQSSNELTRPFPQKRFHVDPVRIFELLMRVISHSGSRVALCGEGGSLIPEMRAF